MQSVQLDATFSALADPTRRAVLARLASGACTVNELAEPFDISLPAFSRHLKVLEHAGLITRGRDRQFRPCTIAPEPLRQATGWMQQYRELWEGRLDRLDTYLMDLQANTNSEDADNEQD